MLCEYLGFSETDVSITSRTLYRNDIATGDFICYKTQSEEISCCVHLKPSKKKGIWMPYTTCKNMYVGDSQIAQAANPSV